VPKKLKLTVLQSYTLELLDRHIEQMEEAREEYIFDHRPQTAATMGRAIVNIGLYKKKLVKVWAFLHQEGFYDEHRRKVQDPSDKGGADNQKG